MIPRLRGVSPQRILGKSPVCGISERCECFDVRLLASIAWLIASLVATTSAKADCFEQAAVRYDVPVELLRAVAWVESGSLDAAKAENLNANGTRDIGRMQINSSHLPQLAAFGIDERWLRDECTSIHVGAWLLAHGINRFGLTWEAVGSYNVGCRALSPQECSRRRNLYAWRVAKALERQAQAPAKSGQRAAAVGQKAVPAPTSPAAPAARASVPAAVPPQASSRGGLPGSAVSPHVRVATVAEVRFEE